MQNETFSQRVARVRKAVNEGKAPKLSSGFLLALLDAADKANAIPVADILFVCDVSEGSGDGGYEQYTNVRKWLEQVKS